MVWKVQGQKKDQKEVVMWGKQTSGCFPTVTIEKQTTPILLSGKKDLEKMNPGRQHTAFDFPSLNVNVMTHISHHRTYTAKGSGH